MIVTTRLLTTSSLVSAVVSRNIHIVGFQREFKIAGTKDPQLKRSVFAKIAKVSTLLDFSTFVDGKNSNGSVKRRDRGGMETLLDVCDPKKNFDSGDCEIMNGLGESLPSSVENLDKINIDETEVDDMGRRKIYSKSMNKQKYKSMRPWTPVGSATAIDANLDSHFVVKILSYNILAQNLLETHKYLYKQHNKESLNWDRRIILLQQEILKAEANVICLQEMLVDHLEEFLMIFRKCGYDYIYKKRTNDKRDGLLLLYRENQLRLVDHVQVELYQPKIDILNRDNVALIAKFSLIDSPETNFIVATTHLLYNPRREDVRLAQTQLLFAELERMAFVELTKKGSIYHPIVLCGDFNLQPYSSVYKFITEGVFEFRGRGCNLEPVLFRGLGNSLIPPSLLVTDNCQYYNLLVKRLRGDSDDTTTNDLSDASEKSDDETENRDKVNTRTFEYQNVKIVEGQYATFSSGSLTHPFNLSSLYQHTNINGVEEATTHQGKWITVDYIFYSGLEPQTKYNLPSVEECKNLPTIPNNVVGSDHLCLGATFKLKKIKR